MSITTVKEFGQAVRNYRLKRNLSQQKLGDICGLHRTYIGSVERGEKNATIKVVFTLAEALEVEPGDFFEVISD